MFDDQQPQPGSPTMSKKSMPPEDIFSDVAEESAPPRPVPPVSPAPTSNLGRGAGPAKLAGDPPIVQAPGLRLPAPPPSHAGTAKKFLLIGVIAVLVIIAAALLAGLILRSKKAIVPVAEPASAPSVTTPIEDLVPEPVPEPVSPAIPIPTPEPVVVDSDRDGLSDSEETALGTSPRSADTDADGLSDRDEVKQWKTNPLNPDTDGDTYKDGDEVRNGYNPKGAGKLFAVPVE